MTERKPMQPVGYADVDGTFPIFGSKRYNEADVPVFTADQILEAVERVRRAFDDAAPPTAAAEEWCHGWRCGLTALLAELGLQDR